MFKLSLDSLTLTDTAPEVAIRAAAEAGFDACSLWIIPPPLFPSPPVTPANERDCARAIAETGIEIIALEVFDLSSIGAAEGCRPLLEMGARLGGKAALAINYSNPDPVSAAETLARFAEVASEFGLATNLEPVAGGQCRTLSEAEALIRAAGADVGICLDPHHLLRAGGSVEDIAHVEGSRIRYLQLCDGPIPQPSDIAGTEAVCERLYPGDGDFPLREFLLAARRDVPLGIECPSLRRARSGVSAVQQAREAFEKVQRLLSAG